MTPKPIWAFPIAVDRPLRQAGLARRRVGSRSRFKTRKKEASMVAEGAPNLPIHPRPSADPLNHLNGLLSADVRQLGNAVLVSTSQESWTCSPDHLFKTTSTNYSPPDLIVLSSISAKSRSW